MKMKSTMQIRLPARDKAALKRIAQARRTGISDLVREAIVKLIAGEATPPAQPKENPT